MSRWNGKAAPLGVKTTAAAESSKTPGAKAGIPASRPSTKAASKPKPPQLRSADMEAAAHAQALATMSTWATRALGILKRDDPETAKAVDEAVCRRGAGLVVVTTVSGGEGALQLSLVDLAGDLHPVMTVSTGQAPRKAN